MKAQTKQRGRPTLHSLKILKEAKKKITDKQVLAEINSVIRITQGINSGRLICFRQW
jgi:hypothetical protein